MIDKIIPFVNVPSEDRNLPDLKQRNKQTETGSTRSKSNPKCLDLL